MVTGAARGARTGWPPAGPHLHGQGWVRLAQPLLRAPLPAVTVRGLPGIETAVLAAQVGQPG